MMRSGFLSAATLLFGSALQAQVALTPGTYTQNFDSVAAGLPAGWSVFTSSTQSSLGTPGAFTSAATAWNAATTGTDFRNISSDNIATGSSSSDQAANANRAVGWRPVGGSATQVAPGRNGSVAVAITSTAGLAVNALSVRVFTGNNVAQDQTYQFEYRVGDAGDFTPIGSPYTTSTPFNATTLTADSAALAPLSNRSQTIHIRVRGTSTAGSSNLDTLGIDDFSIATAPLPATNDPPGAAPSITLQPAGYTGVVGDHVTLTAAAAGTPAPTYQWEHDGAPRVGATSATLTIPSAAVADSGLYMLVATNSSGTAVTIPVAVTITKKPQSLTLTDPPAVLPAGSSVTLLAESTSGLPVSLSLVSGAGALSGNVLTGSGGPVVVRASQPGDVQYAAATVERTFTFVAGALAPFITSPPSDQTVSIGATVNFRAAAIGTPAPVYQWEKDGVPLAGATKLTLTLEKVTFADAGRYTVAAENSVGNASATATLTVRGAPVVLESPADQSVAAGTPTTLRAEVAGFPVPTYQWRKDGVAIPGAINRTFTLASPRHTDAGRYDVVATNELGTATSAGATLNVVWRDFTGAYFGRFAGGDGEFALHVRGDDTAAFVAHLPGHQMGLAVLDLPIDLEGNFTLATTALGVAAAARELPSATAELAVPPATAATQAITLRGALDEISGTVSGAIPELSAAFSGVRAARSGPATAQAGFYTAALVGSASRHGYIAVGADGQVFVFTSSGGTIDSASGTIGSDGRLRVNTAQGVALDLGFDDDRISGTAQLPGAASGTMVGAAEEITGGEHLVNVSVRSTTTPASALIAGFVIAGSMPKQVLIRAAGPALALQPFNLANRLVNPAIQLFRGDASVAQNNNWGTPAANAAPIRAAAARVGAFAFRNGSADAALLRTLAPGAYTVIVSGGTGIALAEVYEVWEPNEAAGTRRLVNVSARGAVAAASPLIAGFVISGTAPQRVLIRGIGPTLAAAPFNVPGMLPNPRLTLFRGSTAIKTNDDWFRDPEAALTRTMAAAVGAFALGAESLDAAMLVYLEPGAYTAQVSGHANAPPASANGNALVEVYEVAP